jgi:predicted nucleic-acid-binding protein
MNKERAWLDANIILRFLLKDHPEYFKAAYHLFSEAERGNIILYLHPLILAEVVWTLQGYYGYQKAEIALILGEMIESDGLLVEEKEVVRKAFEDYAGKNVDYVDAYLSAHALIKGPQVIYTLDKKNFSRLEGDIRILP